MQRAIEQGRVVEFSYLKAGEENAHVRRVQPYALSSTRRGGTCTGSI
jgi:proteasome accessory factor B